MGHLTQQWPLRAGRTGWLAAAVAAMLLLGAVSLLDAEVAHFAQALPEPVVTVFGWITRLGESDYILIPAAVVFFVCAGLALVLRRRIPKLALWQAAGIAAFVFAGIGLPGLITGIVKRIIGRSRPSLLDTVGPLDFRTWSWTDWTYQSFPSGHTTTAFAICFVVSFLVPRAYPFMLAFAVLVGLSRIVVGAHYPTDLIGGAIVGTLGAYLVRNVFAWRGWVFRFRADGSVAMRPAHALRRMLRRRY
ncbi:MAG TPA: phosphatase PAP2 family protein [Alphaproteobacteria bacterium]|nr:phosphatase PAP2 family protein [Alphaproteobacteria bacterium]